jgi:hypothetical protein
VGVLGVGVRCRLINFFVYITPSLENKADNSIKIINILGIEYVKHIVMREYDFKK